MTNVYIDIETIRHPDYQPDLADMMPPRNYKDPEKIDLWKQEKAKEYAEKAALDPSHAQVVAIGFATDWSAPAAVIADPSLDSPAAQELDLFSRFWEALSELVSERRNPDSDYPIWIGHNVAFDLVTLWRRHVILNMAPKYRFNHMASPWSGRWHDTMRIWEGQKGAVMGSLKLDDIAQSVLGYGKVDDPRLPQEMWGAGDYQAVLDRVYRDVELVQELFSMFRDVGGWS